MVRFNRLDTPLNRGLFEQELRESWITELDALVMDREISEQDARWLMDMIDPEAHGYEDWLENSELHEEEV
jgi:hypothetical protein